MSAALRVVGRAHSRANEFIPVVCLSHATHLLPMSSTGDGGALFAVGHDSEVTFAVRESVFSNNQASGYGGGLYVSNISSPAWSASVPAPMFLTSEWRSNSAGWSLTALV